MDFSKKILALALLLSVHLELPFALAAADVKCEDLNEDNCAFAVSAESKRCVLESMPNGVYACKTSDVVVENIISYTETAACLGACGLDRKTVGISSDALLDSGFVAKLCSPGCSQNCPNIVDLYTNLASGEGAALRDLCEKLSANPRRGMVEFSSSGAAAGSGSGYAEAPSPSASRDAQAPSPSA